MNQDFGPHFSTRRDRLVDNYVASRIAVKASRVEFSERFEREARAVAGLNHPPLCLPLTTRTRKLPAEISYPQFADSLERKHLVGPFSLYRARAVGSHGKCVKKLSGGF